MQEAGLVFIADNVAEAAGYSASKILHAALEQRQKQLRLVVLDLGTEARARLEEVFVFSFCYVMLFVNKKNYIKGHIS